MTLYDIHCDRCGGDKPHKVVQDDETDHVQTRTLNDTDVYCLICERGQSKADLDGDTDIYAVASIEQGIGLSVHPDFIREDETLEDHIERVLKEEKLGRLAAELADGIRESDVELAYYEREDPL